VTLTLYSIVATIFDVWVFCCRLVEWHFVTTIEWERKESNQKSIQIRAMASAHVHLIPTSHSFKRKHYCCVAGSQKNVFLSLSQTLLLCMCPVNNNQPIAFKTSELFPIGPLFSERHFTKILLNILSRNKIHRSLLSYYSLPTKPPIILN
jgi:hypothetical protein